MKHTLVTALVAVVAVLAIGTTVAWAAGHSPLGHMGNGHMQQMGNGHMGQMDQAAMRALMAKVHPGLDSATLAKLAQQCTAAMNAGSMHDSDDMGGMMGGSGSNGMMGTARAEG